MKIKFKSELLTPISNKLHPLILWYQYSESANADPETTAAVSVDIFQLPTPTYPRQTLLSVCVAGEREAREETSSRVQFVSLL